MIVPVTELRNGTAFKEDGGLFLVLKYKHVNLGRGKANIKVKVRNLKTDSVTKKTFISGQKIDLIDLETKQGQYLYRDQDGFYFMDPETFEQFRLEKSVLGDKRQFLKEGTTYSFLFFEKEPLSFEVPIFLELEVKETGPDVKGDSATNIYKKATMENDLVVSVPLFIKKGEKIKVDTRTGEYGGRA